MSHQGEMVPPTNQIEPVPAATGIVKHDEFPDQEESSDSPDDASLSEEEEKKCEN